MVKEEITEEVRQHIHHMIDQYLDDGATVVIEGSEEFERPEDLSDDFKPISRSLVIRLRVKEEK